MLRQAGHRLVVSPWFAAGAGVVIATGVMIYTPHAHLNPAIQVTPCKQAKCPQEKKLPLGGPPPQPAGTGAPVTTPSKASVPRGMTFWYQPVDQSTGSEFGMWIAIRYPRSVSPWQLSFVINGATGPYVYFWPRWHMFGTDGVTVSSLVAGTESAGYAEISAHDAANDGGSSPTGYLVLFQVRGSGPPSRPSQCTFNGASCTFRPSSTLAPAAGQYSG